MADVLQLPTNVGKDFKKLYYKFQDNWSGRSGATDQNTATGSEIRGASPEAKVLKKWTCNYCVQNVGTL